MLNGARNALATLLVISAGQGAGAEAPRAPVWNDAYTTRLEALALLQTLNAELLGNDSATLTLDHWCDTHRLAAPARIVAERIVGADQDPTPEQRQILGVSAAEQVRFRRVRLKCGEHVLSEAENWYVPSRLPPDMNRVLETTEIPFGRVVKPLDFRRHTLSAKLLWSPLPSGWEMGGATEQGAVDADSSGANDGALHIPHEVLQHRAVLTLRDGTPFSHVIETYTGDVLAFPEPKEPAAEKH